MSALNGRSDSLLKVVTDAIYAQHGEEIKAYLSGDLPVNQWRPEKYAEVALQAIRDAGYAILSMPAEVRSSEVYDPDGSGPFGF